MEENKIIKFDTNVELKGLSIDRLFNLQKMQLDMIQYYLMNDILYNKNDIFNTLQEIIAINMVISKKIKHVKK